MKRTISLLAALLLTLVTTAWADWRDLHGRTHTDGPSAKGIGPLSAQLFFRRSKDETIQNWGGLANQIFIVSQTSVHRGETTFAMVGFNGCVMKPGRHCNLTVTYKVFKPSEEIYGESPEVELWQREEPRTGNVLMPGVGFLEIQIENTDPIGRYRVEARILDHNANSSITLTSAFEVKM